MKRNREFIKPISEYLLVIKVLFKLVYPDTAISNRWLINVTITKTQWAISPHINLLMFYSSGNVFNSICWKGSRGRDKSIRSRIRRGQPRKRLYPNFQARTGDGLA